MKSRIGLKTVLRKRASKKFENSFYKIRYNAVFSKTMEIVGNHCNIKLVSTCYLASEVNYHVTKLFSKKLKWSKAIEMNKTKVKMEKPIYLGFCNVGLKKNEIYEFWYNHIKE